MKTLLISEKNNILSVGLNRPQVRNAFHPEMIAEITQVFSGIDDSVRAVYLYGEGKSFCAGADLDWMKSMAKFSQEENEQDSVELYNMFEAIRSCPVPVVAWAHGHVMGGALGLLSVSDIVFSSPETKFCFSEVKLGLAPAVISSFVVNKIGYAQASRFFLSAEVFTADQAKHMQLVHEVTDDQEACRALLHQLVSNGPEAVRATKGLLSELRKTNEVKKMTTQLIAKLRVSSEGQEGLASFFEKRKPHWRHQ